MRRATLLVYLALAAVAAIAAAAAQDDKPARDSLITETTGSFSLSNSRDGMPVFSATKIGPGDAAKGSVEIANEGNEKIALTLSQRGLTDVPGTGGGVLSQRLTLKVLDETTPGTVYSGPLAAMPPQSLGTLAPGASRRYEFVAALPDGAGNAAAENAVQGASTSVTYSWTAHEAPAEESASPLESSTSSPATTDSSSPVPPAAQPPRLSVHIGRYRHMLRHGRLLVWARCNQACRLRPAGRHKRSHKFSARTRKLPIWIPPKLRQRAKLRIIVLARNRYGENARAVKRLRLRRPHRPTP